MKRKRILFIGFILMMIFSSCKSTKDLAPYLAQPGCFSPCWQQITPGRSAFEEIKKRLPEIEEVDESSIYIDENEVTFDSCFRWDFIEKNRDGSICIYDNSAAFIGIFGDLGLTLEKALSLYGKPDQLVYDWQAQGDVGTLRIFLFYYKKGFVISYAQYDFYTITIEPKNKIDEILFYDPALYPEIVTDLFRLVGEDALKHNRMAWPGFENIVIPKLD